MRLPIGVLKVGESDGISAVQHGVVAHIDTAMRDPLNVFAHRAFKKHDVARLHLVLRNAGAQAVQPLSPQTAGVVHAAVGEHIAHKP